MAARWAAALLEPGLLVAAAAATSAAEHVNVPDEEHWHFQQTVSKLPAVLAGCF